VAGYGLLRSLIELLRGDEGRGVVGALSTSQGLAAASIVLAAVVVRSAKQP
jgi:hypothetical protein